MPKTTRPAPRPNYNVFGQGSGNLHGIQNSLKPSKRIDLTVANDFFASVLVNPGDDLDASEPLQLIDSVQATESIKALLQGAVEDDDERPRLRRRNIKQKKEENELASALGEMCIAKVKDGSVQAKSDDVVGQESDGEDEDDGVIEGLEVRLLPHQVDGVHWMIDKEIGKRKNGILPKGGILADDVSLWMAEGV